MANPMLMHGSPNCGHLLQSGLRQMTAYCLLRQAYGTLPKVAHALRPECVVE